MVGLDGIGDPCFGGKANIDILVFKSRLRATKQAAVAAILRLQVVGGNFNAWRFCWVRERWGRARGLVC